MLKVLGAQIKEFQKDSILTPVFMILEVIMEMIIPLLMASIIDNGVNAGDLNHIYKGPLQDWRSDGLDGTNRTVGRIDGCKVRCEGIDGLCKKSQKSNV